MTGGMLLAALGIVVAFGGIGASIVGLYNQLAPTPRDTQGELMEFMYLEMAKYMDDEPPAIYLYTAKCPDCGRFVKRLYGLDNVVACHIHGVKAWDNSPIEWRSRPVAPGVTIGHIYREDVRSGAIPLPEPIADIEDEGIADMIAKGARV